MAQTFIYNPLKSQFLVTHNPHVRLVCATRPNKKIDEMYIMNHIENCIENDVEDYIESNEQFAKDMTAFENPTQTNTQKSKDNKPTGNYLPLTYMCDRFKVTEYPNGYLSNDDDDDPYEDAKELLENCVIETTVNNIDKLVDQHINKLVIQKTEKLKHLNIALTHQSQLWNIIIPIYLTHSGTKCPVEIETYYYMDNVVMPKFNFDFMLRNKGLFLEILPINDDTETWYTMESQNIAGILKRFGLSLVFSDIKKAEIEEMIIGNNLKLTYILVDAPQPQSFDHSGCWKCHSHNIMHLYPFIKNTECQYPVKQVIAKHLYDLYEQEKQDQFEKSKWNVPIKFNRVDNFINAHDHNLILNTNERFINLCNDLEKNHNIAGLTQFDIWSTFLQYSITAKTKLTEDDPTISNKYNKPVTSWEELAKDDEYDDEDDCSYLFM
jgi:hypothetical protein